MAKFDYKKWVTENKYGKPLYQMEEGPGEDLELKSLAKKFIPIIKKYGMGIEYVTDSSKFEIKPSSPSSAPAQLLTKDGTLTVAIYWLSLDREKEAGKIKAGKMYQDLMALVPKEDFDSRSPSEMNQYGYYLIEFRKK